MSEQGKPTELSADKQALLAIRKLRAKVEELERSKTEPLAIVGVGCRFPGKADGPDRYWQVLHDGVHAVGPIPRERLDLDTYYDPNQDAPGKIYVRDAALVEDIDRFDAQFFGISPREAASMDPQHRLLLEVTWEALEHAGLAPSSLQGSRTGVFVGIGGSDYAQLQMDEGAAGLDAYFGTGSAMSAAAGRLSYVLGLMGPSVAVDTACSASLVAIHLACQSLRSGECNVALAGGVNVMLSPDVFVMLCRAHMLAPDGRCKTFDAAADGYVRGEGCGMIVLKRLSDAVAAGDSILAVIRGTAVNQDGKSAGFTAPNERAQQQVIREALAAGGVSPEAVDYIEAHGTGTSLGDPIELQALAAVLGANRPPDRPLLVGSVKTNFGHLEWAAGIAGLIKIVLSLKHQEIPPHLHLQTLNPFVNWDELPIRIPTEPTPWPAGTRRRIAGVSSFGFTGTNAHVVLEEAPAIEPRREAIERPLHVLVLSTRSASSLRELASRFEHRLELEANETAADVCFSANTGRSHFSHRLAVAGASAIELRESLAKWAASEPTFVRAGHTPPSAAPPEVVFLFTGQGAQYVGMGRQLSDTQPVFRKALDRCSELFAPHLDRPLLTAMFEEGAQPALNETAITQPALFALEYALAELWRSWGVEPSMVMGHSLGEYVAACVAGVFSLEDAVKLVATRARLMQSLPSGGAMAAVGAGRERLESILGPVAGSLSIAAVNGPAAVVISGDEPSVMSAIDRLRAEGVEVERLNVSHAFHSSLMDPILDAFERETSGVTFNAPRVGIVSNLTGRMLEPSVIGDGKYWRQHLRETVQFDGGLRTLYEQGARVFLEIGPSPTLLSMGRRVLADAAIEWLPSLRRGRSEWATMADTLAALYVKGVPIDWSGFDNGYSRRKVALPTYPFERRRYWIEQHGGRRHLAAVDVLARRDDWLYDVAWERSVIADAGESSPTGDWLVLTDSGGIGHAFATRINGGRCFSVEQANGFRRLNETRFSSGTDAASLAKVVAAFLAGASSPRGVLYLWALDGTETDLVDPANSAQRHVACVINLVLALSRSDVSAAPRVWLVTQGAQSVTEAARAHVGQAPLWGLGRTIAAEHSALWGGLVDLDPSADAATAAASLRAIVPALDDEDQIAVRGGERFVARLMRKNLPADTRNAVVFRADGAYLVTGGFGGIGLEVARWMATRGARRLILLGRHGLPPRSEWQFVEQHSAARARIDAVLALEALGATVETASVDVGDAGQLSSWLHQYRSEQRPAIRGIMHAAGVAQYRLIADHGMRDIEAVWHGKVNGAWLLHTLFADAPLDFFVLFSSASVLINSPLVGSYAAANAFLDALAVERRAAGQPALSVNWGAWSQVGMAAGTSDRRPAASEFVTPDVGVGMLAMLLDRGASRAAVLPIDWTEWQRLHPSSASAPFLRRVIGAGAQAAPVLGGADVSIRAALHAADGAARRDMLAAFVAATVAAVLRLPAEELDVSAPLRSLGLDSLMALEIRNRLQERAGVTVSLVTLIQGPSIADLAETLVEHLDRVAPAAKEAAAADPGGASVDVQQLSDESVDALLRQMLAER